MELGGQCGYGFRHVSVFQRTEFSELYLRCKDTSSLSQNYMLIAVSIKLMVSMSPLVTMQPFQNPTNPCLISTLFLANSNYNSWQTNYRILWFAFISLPYFIVQWDTIQLIPESVSHRLKPSAWLIEKLCYISIFH